MPPHSAETVIRVSQTKVACKQCTLRRLCLPLGFDGPELEDLERIINRPRSVARGEHLFRCGSAFRAIYAVRSGSFKSYAPTDDGEEQVTGFHLPGELIGLDAITCRSHPRSACALESASFCEIPFERLDELSGRLPTLRQQLLRLVSRELLNDQALLALLGKRSAEARVATLLLSLSARLHERGLSAAQFRPSMSRNNIASFLGLAVETVSRVFTRFQGQGLLSAQGKSITLLDPTALKDAAAHGLAPGR